MAPAIDWERVRASGFALPGGARAADLLPELTAMLASPDPQVRDAQGYGAAATWIGRGLLDAELVPLGDAMAARLTSDDRVQARSFAALVLDAILERGPEAGVPGDAVDRWFEAFAAWYPARAGDPRLGRPDGLAARGRPRRRPGGTFGTAPGCTAARRTELLRLCAPG